MKYHLLLLVALLISTNLLSQNKYEEGYYVDLKGIKHNGLILNKDWKNNPSEIKFRPSESENHITKSISEIREFSIVGKSLFQSHVVNIDRSDQEIKSYTYSSEPIYSEEELALRVLIKGATSLYKYEDNKTVRFFIKTDGRIEQLIYKKYKTKSNKIATNYGYRHQLWNALQCGDFSINDLTKIEYKDKSLMDAFKRYRLCSNSPISYIQKKKKYKKMQLGVRVGFRYNSLRIIGLGGQSELREILNANFKIYPGLVAGLELEYIFPYNNNKWSLILQPTYQQYKHTESHMFIDHLVEPTDIIINYKAIELPIGIRYYYLLNVNSKIFVNAMIIPDYSFNSNIKFDNYSYLVNDPIQTRTNLGYGIGYLYKDKFEIELNTALDRNLLGQFLTFKTSYSYVGLNLSYKLL